MTWTAALLTLTLSLTAFFAVGLPVAVAFFGVNLIRPKSLQIWDLSPN